jgi:endonuclease I
MRRELLELEPPDPMIAARADLRRLSSEGQGSAADRGTVSVTVPLTITVALGSQDQSPKTERPVTQASLAPLAPPESRSERLAEPTLPAEAAQALGELEEARRRPYYDADADRRDRDEYWKDISAADLGPQEMFRAVSELLTGSHTNPLGYRPARHVYAWVDLHPGNPSVVKSIYSGQSFDPAELIQEDFRTEARLNAVAERLASLEGLTVESTVDFLEAQLPFNCEHVVPQSWFGKKEPMRGDLHHLFTCESRCNSFRGNTPYFDFADFQEVIRSECGKREGEKFEPFAGKGPVARATLYFLLRYPDEIERLPDQYDDERLATLLAWHRADLPGEYELHRNAAIREKQGNRNPLIDFPDWGERIDFALGLGG